MNRQACQPTPGRYFTATRPPLGRYFTNTRPTLSSLGQLLLTSSIFPALLREAFSGRRPFLALNSGNIHVFFSATFIPRHRFYIQPSLLSEVAAFGDCCFWRLVIIGEQKMIEKVGKEIADISAKQRLTVDRYLTDSRPIH